MCVANSEQKAAHKLKIFRIVFIEETPLYDFIIKFIYDIKWLMGIKKLDSIVST